MTSSLYTIAPEATEIEQAQSLLRHLKLLNPEPYLTDATLHWAKATTIGLDTEFVRERSFFPRPGLIQICDGQHVWLLDAAAKHDFEHLGQMLRQDGITKVLHSVGEDLEIFQIVCGSLPRPLFDTQIAAAMLGLPLQVRYENLVERCFGISLPGGKARSDWCARPLAAELLEYAAQDVIWLPRLHDYLCNALEARGRLDWLREDCDRLIDTAKTNASANQALARVKGAGRLEDAALAWLQTLVTWRELQARQRDLPRSFVARDEAMVETALRLSRLGAVQSALAALPAALLRRHGKDLLAWLASTGPAENFQRPAELIALDSGQRTWLKEAQENIRRQAEGLEVEPALIASKRDLTRLVRGEQPDWLSGWRSEFLTRLPKP